MPTRDDPYVVRPQRTGDRDRILDHLLALDAVDRFLRFGTASNAGALTRYVDAIDFERSTVLGVEGPDGSLIGAAHIALGDGFAELGISVSSAHRQRGVATALAAAAVRAAEGLGAREFRIHFAATNDGMRRLARQLGMDVSADGSDLIASRGLGAGGECRGAHGFAAPVASSRPVELAETT